MPASKEFLDLVLDRLSHLGAVTWRSMFGGFGVFHEGDMFGLIANDVLYLKADDSNRDDYVKRGSQQYKPMPYFRVPDDGFEDADELLKWAQKAVMVAHTAPKKQR